MHEFYELFRQSTILAWEKITEKERERVVQMQKFGKMKEEAKRN